MDLTHGGSVYGINEALVGEDYLSLRENVGGGVVEYR